MHDPLTVAHEIKNPFRRGRKVSSPDGTFWRSRPSFITVWHKDPERDGSDDSCGWSWPKLTKAQQSNLRFLGGCEARDPWFQAAAAKQIENPTDAETLMRAAFILVARQLRIKITTEEATIWAIEMIHSPADNVRSLLAFLPGYHSNSAIDNEESRTDEATRFFGMIAKHILRERRPWYRHPRWHINHWQVQIHPVMHFKRWAFSRCSQCGGRFGWGVSPLSDNWYGTGPRWFRSESGVRHGDCSRPQSEGSSAAVSDTVGVAS